MMFNRRDGGAHRHTWLRVSIFFLAAGLWLAGVITGNTWLTGAAIGILAIGVLLRFAGRTNADG
jgi:hypothetical protein